MQESDHEVRPPIEPLHAGTTVESPSIGRNAEASDFVGTSTPSLIGPTGGPDIDSRSTSYVPEPPMSRTSGFLDPADYPFVEAFERNAPLIHGELVEVMETYPFRSFRHRPDGGRMVFEEGWEVFGFYERGRKLSLPPSICPRTRELVDTVPDIVTAGFSKLAGGARVKPHSGKRDLIRCHLGLIIPPGCRFRVGDEVREWEVNKCLLFDNTAVHEAWNDSAQDRVILVVDFVHHRDADMAIGDVGPAK